VSLAAEFSKTPFDEAFSKLQMAVAAKQQYETFMIKQIVTNFRFLPDIASDAEAQQAAQVLHRKLMARQEQLDKGAREQVQAVKHSLTIEAMN
jgi:hypothetical protein